MINLTKYQSQQISGGKVVWNGNEITVTGPKSSMNLNGLHFTSTQICIIDDCTQEMFNQPIMLGDMTIIGQKIEDGAIYTLS
jgi:hypothetical protein